MITAWGSLQLQRPEGPPHGGGGELHRPAERLADLHGTGGDPEAILRYGRNLLKMDAFGCTSRGQAHRAGLWVIKTGLLETQTVDFTLGSQGLRHTPGDIIEICDNDYAGTMTGGRILSIDAASRTLTLDREVTLPETGVPPR